MNQLQKVLDLIAEHEATAQTDAHDERQDLGSDYDPNSYGAGFSEGVISTSRQLREAVTALLPAGPPAAGAPHSMTPGLAQQILADQARIDKALKVLAFLEATKDDEPCSAREWIQYALDETKPDQQGGQSAIAKPKPLAFMGCYEGRGLAFLQKENGDIAVLVIHGTEQPDDPLEVFGTCSKQHTSYVGHALASAAPATSFMRRMLPEDHPMHLPAHKAE